ncbi:MAG: isochorismate synthase [Betaproteobacteria bacterium]|nr:isochorismate synthase [Betaproteobacteria bacterium]
MKPGRLLDASRLAGLRRRLDKLLAHAPEHGLVSITLDLGESASAGDDWLPGEICREDTLYWAQPDNGGDYRLALGRAVAVTSAGAGRFTALQAAFNGLLPVWQHDGGGESGEGAGVAAAAHIGFAFEDDTQDELPNARLCVPAILLRGRGGRSTATFSCTVRDGKNAIANWLETLRAAAAPGPARRPDTPVRQATPLNDRAFLARAQAALNDIGAGKILKVVLTRRVRFGAGQNIPIAPLLAALAQRHPQCTIYGVGQPGSAFVGATPERLVSLDKGVVCADALAGTAWLNAVSGPAKAGSLTLQGDKNSHEQQLVVDAVRTALAPLCASLDPPQTPEIMRLRELQHLRTRIAGRLRDDVDLFDLLAHLHPTPAVGGTPTAAARQWLDTHGERRGAWYTGGIGWIDRRGDGEVVVPLRCAEIRGAQADLFAGAGIVAGSDPAQELAETEVKLGTIADALRHAARTGERLRSGPGKTGTA